MFQGQEDCKFKGSFSYIARPCLKQNRNEKEREKIIVDR